MSDVSEAHDYEKLPEWAIGFYEDYGAPDLIGLADVFHGPLMDRKFGLTFRLALWLRS